MSQEKYGHEAMRWLKQANADLNAARNSITSKNFEWAAFQAQQAAEKAVKALWYHSGSDPWGHSIVKLLQDFPKMSQYPALADLMSNAKKLDKLYILTRYPNGLPDMIPAEVYTAEEAQSAVDAALEIIRNLSSIIIP